MNQKITKLTVLTLFVVALAVAPVCAHAQGANANTSSASDQTTASKPAKRSVIPFRGKLAALDTKAMTLTVGKRTFQITADTKIFKNDNPATLSAGVVGEPVSGTYKKIEGGKLEAVNVHFGARNGGKQKQPSSSGN
jgi:hypothetical protein